MKRHVAPIIVAILLLLPVLYVGSYFALLDLARGNRAWVLSGATIRRNYRCGGVWAERIFWPLEQIDRKVRPEAWDTPGTP